MSTIPNMRKYRKLTSALIISVIAVIALTIGLLCLAAGLFGPQQPTNSLYVLVGVICFITSLFLFIISNIAEDIHYQTYLKEFYGEEVIQYNEDSLLILRDIQAMLQQANSPQEQEKHHEPIWWHPSESDDDPAQ